MAAEVPLPPANRRRLINKLPGARHTRNDYQHLLWTRRGMLRIGRTDIRNYRCAGVARVDTELHSLWHEIWEPPDLNDPKVIAAIDDIGRRHEAEVCTCPQDDRPPVQKRVRVDALTLLLVGDGSALPPCMIWKIDPVVLRFLRRHVNRSTKTRLGGNVRRLLVDQHDRRLCGCYNR